MYESAGYRAAGLLVHYDDVVHTICTYSHILRPCKVHSQQIKRGTRVTREFSVATCRDYAFSTHYSLTPFLALSQRHSVTATLKHSNTQTLKQKHSHHAHGTASLTHSLPLCHPCHTTHIHSHILPACLPACLSTESRPRPRCPQLSE